MEVYSGQKRVKPWVTIAAAAVVLIVALLQAFSLEIQKNDYWLSQLGSAVVIDDQLSVRVPRDWHRVDEAESASAWFIPPSDPDNLPRLWIHREAPGGITTLREACNRVFALDADGGGSGTIGGFDPVPCRLGPYPAQLAIAHQQITPQSALVRFVILVSLHQEVGTTIMVMFPGTSEDVQQAKYLLLKMGETAKVFTNS